MSNKVCGFKSSCQQSFLPHTIFNIRDDWFSFTSKVPVFSVPSCELRVSWNIAQPGLLKIASDRSAACRACPSPQHIYRHHSGDRIFHQHVLRSETILINLKVKQILRHLSEVGKQWLFRLGLFNNILRL